MPNQKPHIGDVLLSIMDAKNLRQADIAKLLKTSPTSVGRILRKQVETVDITTVRELARIFNLTIGQMTGDEPLPHNLSSPGAYPIQTVSYKLCPVLKYGQIRAYMEGIIVKETQTLPCPEPCGDGTFCLQNNSNANFPTYRPDEFIFIDPSVNPSANSDVLVRSGEDYLVRKLVVEGGSTYLEAHNPDWPNPIVPYTSGMEIIGVVIFSGASRLPKK